MRKTGTKEWAENSRNCLNGCSHNCRYCYAKTNALSFKLIWDEEKWKNPSFNDKCMNFPFRKLPGRIMFPSIHDILPEFLDDCMAYMRCWLEEGNTMLVVSKPHFVCIEAICRELEEFKDLIEFRFTIGSMDSEILAFWEPGAPDYEERKKCLKYAFDNGWQTSISAEPFLDDAVDELYEDLEPYITGTFWIGKMNQIGRRVKIIDWTPEQMKRLQLVNDSQTDEAIKELHQWLKLEPKIRWKDSIKKVMNLKAQGKVE